MKSMTCKELGGACDETFTANTFEEIAEQSKQHGMAMFQQQDADHLAAMAAMKELMQNPQAMQAWYEEKKKSLRGAARRLIRLSVSNPSIAGKWLPRAP